MAINIGEVIQGIKSTEDKIAEQITNFSGTMLFVYVHVIWFGTWVLCSFGFFGEDNIFDPFPYGLLTLVVSLEAIFLATFVMITQNRESKNRELRDKINYLREKKEEETIRLIMKTLERIAQKQGIETGDLLEEFEQIKRGVENVKFDEQ